MLALMGSSRVSEPKNEEKHLSIDQDASPIQSSDKLDSTRKKLNIKKLENALSKDKNIAKRRKELKLILTNKPINFFDPEGSRQLETKIDRIN